MTSAPQYTCFPFLWTQTSETCAPWIWKQKTRINGCDNQQPLVTLGKSPRSICREVCEQRTPTNHMTNYSFPLGNVETLLLATHRNTAWYLSNFTVSCMHLHLIVFSTCRWTSSYTYVFTIKNTLGQISAQLCD